MVILPARRHGVRDWVALSTEQAEYACRRAHEEGLQDEITFGCRTTATSATVERRDHFDRQVRAHW